MARGPADSCCSSFPLRGWRAASSVCWLLTLGVLTAASPRLRPLLVFVLANALGLMHGWLNGAAIAAAGREASGLFGIAATIFVVVALAAALVVSLRKPWMRIVVRVTGSWIAAVGLLVLGWSLRGVLA